MDSIITNRGSTQSLDIDIGSFQYALNIATAIGISNCTIPCPGICIVSTIATISQTSRIYLNGNYVISPVGESSVSTKRFATYALIFSRNSQGTFDAVDHNEKLYTNVTYIGCNNQDMHIVIIPYES